MSVLWAVAALLILVWAALLVFKVLGAFVHVLLIAAAVFFVIGMFTGRRTTL